MTDSHPLPGHVDQDTVHAGRSREGRAALRATVDLDDPRRVAAASRLAPTRGSAASLDRLAALAARLLGTRSAQISLLTDRQVVAGGHGAGWSPSDAAPTSREATLCTVTAQSDQALVVPDASHDPVVDELPPVADGTVGSYLGVPLRSAEGLVVGSLCVYDAHARTWDGDEVHLLTELASSAESELELVAVAAERDQAEFRLSVAHAAGGIGSWEWVEGEEVLRVDEQAMATLGAPLGAGLLRLADVEGRLDGDDVERFRPALLASAATGADYAADVRLLGTDGRQRWLVLRARPLTRRGDGVRLVGAVYDVTEKHEADASASASSDLLGLLAAASDALSGSLRAEDAVRSLTRVVVPLLADWSVVSLLGDDGVLRDVEWWHHDPEQRPLTEVFARHRLDGRTEASGALAAFRSGEPFVLDTGVREFARQTLRSATAEEALDALDLASVVVLPLLVDGEVIGLMTLARGEARPPVSPAELATAVDVSRRAGTTLAMARAYGLEREMSEGLQRSLLTAPTQPEHAQVEVRYLPAARAAQVGGDWYDAFPQPDGSTLLVVGDVVGHDSAAAAAMGQLRNLLRGIAVAGGSPADVLTRMDAALETLRLDTTATALVARVEGRREGESPDPGSARVRWSNAGHPPAVVVQPDGRLITLDEHDLLLGVVAGSERRDHVVELVPGATLLMYSDGLVERRGEELDDGIDRLCRALVELGGEPIDVVADELLARLVPWEAEDDVALLAIRQTGAGPIRSTGRNGAQAWSIASTDAGVVGRAK